LELGTSSRARPFEWQTIALLCACYAVWLISTYLFGSTWAALPFAVISVTFHSSLQHEALHGHPTRKAWINEAMVWLPVGIFVPYRRFKTLHIKHHNNELLTDPYDDPESFYRDWRDWERLPWVLRRLLEINNTLVGRLVIGPAISVVGFIGSDLRLMLGGDRKVLIAWAHHAAGLLLVAIWVWGVCGINPVVYVLAVAYPGMSLLMIRTFAEHQAQERVGSRSVIVEDRGFFALLFLNNNLHLVHHDQPGTPWYHLPAIYRARKAHWHAENGGYVFRGYGELFRRYAFRSKEPVPHPFLRRG